MFWGIFIADVLTDQCKCGVNIGLALLLFFSPLIITPGAFASGYVVRRLTNTPRPPDATGP